MFACHTIIGVVASLAMLAAPVSAHTWVGGVDMNAACVSQGVYHSMLKTTKQTMLPIVLTTGTARMATIKGTSTSVPFAPADTVATPTLTLRARRSTTGAATIPKLLENLVKRLNPSVTTH